MDYSAIAPELLIASTALLLLLFGAYNNAYVHVTKKIFYAAMIALVVAGYFMVSHDRYSGPVFNGMFIQDGFSIALKLIIMLAAVLVLMLSTELYKERNGIAFEFPVLVLLSVVGMMIMVSAHDLMSLYMGLELQSLALYVLVAIRRVNDKGAEAALKYFVLGAVASGILLFGISYIYGFIGTTNFASIADAIQGEKLSTAATFGIVLCMSAILFKLSTVPFHMWTPDVYEGAPKVVTAFLASAPKVAAVGLLVRLLYQPLGAHPEVWVPIIVLVSMASMIWGALAALRQTNIKRLLAYSSIGHMGYLLVGVAAASEAGVSSAVLYMALYVLMNAGVFGCILLMKRHGEYLEDINELAGMSRNHPIVAGILAILMFSMAGIPPMAGFFGKFYVFKAALDAELFALAIVGVLTSVIGAFYYLRIIKVMYFDEPVEVLDRVVSKEVRLVLAISAVFNLLFFIAPAQLLEMASTAADMLL